MELVECDNRGVIPGLDGHAMAEGSLPHHDTFWDILWKEKAKLADYRKRKKETMNVVSRFAL